MNSHSDLILSKRFLSWRQSVFFKVKRTILVSQTCKLLYFCYVGKNAYLLI